ncbi:MmgE/PrpD family protein [Bradyrhizobium sp. B097]|uniref:MmgE/PrpD family protein n=1 Tax=Bradyrhizobium sp. B097 TaxID=3140244 RepID=UPI003182BC9E
MQGLIRPAPQCAHDAAAIDAIGATDALARFVAQTSFADLPEPAVRVLRCCFLDYVGNSAFASLHGESSPAIRAAIARLDAADGPGTVIGEGRGYSWQYAALLNGAYAHTLDFDDTNQGHPGAPVISAALVEAERVDAGGTAFLEALAVGYEVYCRVGGAITIAGYDRGFHITAIAGIFGSVAAVSKLRGLDPPAIGNAFGLALSKASGSMQYLENGSWNKRLHPGFAAHDAFLCVTMAEAGVIGAAAAIEGRYGVLTSFTGAPQPGILTNGLGTQWTLLRTAIKPYPSCRFTHSAIDAAIALRQQISAADLSRAAIHIGLSPVAMKIVGERSPAKLDPRNNVDAQFSVYFQAAAAWLDGKLEWSSYQRLGAPDIVALAQRITTHVDPAMQKIGSSFTVEIDGITLSRTIDTPLGEPECPLDWNGLTAKFLSLAEPTYGSAKAAAIEQAVRTMGPATAMSGLVKGLRRAAATPLS